MRALSAIPQSSGTKRSRSARPRRTRGLSPLSIRPYDFNVNSSDKRKPACPCGGGCPKCRDAVPLQAKLTVGAPDDAYEQEADRVAEQVMRMPVTDVQRQPEDEDDELLQTKPLDGGLTAPIRRQEEEEEEEEEFVQTKAVPGQVPEVGGSLAGQIGGLKGGGHPLPAAERAFFEPRFGRNFGDVRLHTDGAAAETARALNAKAYTTGRHVVFSAGQYAPQSEAGRRLLAHELTHVLQQGDRSVGAHSKLRVGPTDDGFETKSAATTDHGIQRFATFVDGDVDATNNLAAQAAQGAYAGVTYPVLNETPMSAKTNPEALVEKPVLRDRSKGGMVECRVKRAATNIGSFDMKTLSPGPWSYVTTKENVRKNLDWTDSGFEPSACVGDEPCTLMAGIIGNVAAAVRAHEDRHAVGHEKAFYRNFNPWDGAVTAAAEAKTTFSGADRAACEGALWAAMGGTAEKTARDYHSDCFEWGRRFHDTPAGAKLPARIVEVSPDCSIVKFAAKG